MINSRVQQIVNEISHNFYKVFNKKNVSLIWFGSWVKGNAYLQSDIDLAIEHKIPLNKKQLRVFEDYLDSIPTLYSIDLVDIDNAGVMLKKEIKKYGQIL